MCSFTFCTFNFTFQCAVSHFAHLDTHSNVHFHIFHIFFHNRRRSRKSTTLYVLHIYWGKYHTKGKRSPFLPSHKFLPYALPLTLLLLLPMPPPPLPPPPPSPLLLGCPRHNFWCPIHHFWCPGHHLVPAPPNESL